ncbi:MAG: trehalase family glycosidase [Bacteroidota bacterium]
MTKQNLFLVIALLLTWPNYGQEIPSQQGALVWASPEGGQRNEYLFFKRKFVLAPGETITKATLHLYADSRYALYINGQYISFGPARSYHANPYFDSYDIADYLVEGDNCIVVKVLHNGMVTYQLFDYKGAFAAWGELKTDKKTVSLQSLQWKVQPSKGYDRSAPRFSFAAGPIENWNVSEDEGWNNCELQEGWKSPVLLADSSPWGAFLPRPIPPLINKPYLAEPYDQAYALDTTLQIHAFRVPTKDETPKDYNTRPSAVAYTYIYSPIAQQVQMGLWWERSFVNGKPLTDRAVVAENRFRKTFLVDLKQGWNTYHAAYDVLWGSWDFYMQFPKKAGLRLSTTKDLEGDTALAHYKLPQGEAPLWYSQIPRTPFKTILEEVGSQWTLHPQGNNANHPARDLVWNGKDTLRTMGTATILGKSFQIQEGEKGISLYFKMEEIQLGCFFIEGRFPKGTVLDLGFSEEPNAQGFPWLYKRYQIGAGIRFVTDGTTERYESFKPYGAKYLQLNISGTNAPFTLDKVGMMRMVYPFETKGAFHSSDTIFNKTYEAGWRTLQLCAEDSYTDTPFRERGLYAGDFLPELAITMAVSGDMRLARHSLSLFQDMYRSEMYEGTETRHHEFVFITLLSADYLWRYLKDKDIITQYYENYKALLEQTLALRKRENGLIYAKGVFLEWTTINKTDAQMTAYQAVIYKSLRILQEWAEVLGKVAEANYFAQEAAALQKAVLKELWYQEEHRFYDGIQSGDPIQDYHITSTIWPMCYGLLPKAEQAQALKAILAEIQDIGNVTRQRKITTYSSFYLLCLLYQNDEVAAAEQFIKKHWAPMALHSERPTVWENFDIGGLQGTSSHAWSGHPTYFMATETLGVNLGFYKPFDADTIEIHPRSELLSQAAGTVTHPRGLVSLSWKIQGNDLILKVKVPKDVPTTIAPKGRLASLNLVLEKETY